MLILVIGITICGLIIAAFSLFVGIVIGSSEPRKVVLTSRPMTPEEVASFNRAFDRIDDAFNELRDLI